MSAGLLSRGGNLAARERLVTPKGKAPTPKRVSKTTYPATSGMGALEAATGGSYAFDRPPQRPDDLSVLHHAVQHSPGVKAVAEMTRDPLGIVQGVQAVKDVVKHPGVGTGIGAGVSMAGLLFPGARKLKEIAKEAEPLDEGAAAVVRGSMKGAKVARGKQEAGYSVERSKRFAKASEHLNNQSLEPEERLRLAKSELKGELPKINFQGMSELNEESLKNLQTHILNHPHLLPGQKIRASEALSGALQGKVPTRSELTLLEHVFGKDTADALGYISKHPYRDLLLSALNVPRSLMASFDLSAPFRQGLVVATRHPAIFAKNFKPMIKAFGSESVYHGILSDIRSRPTYPMMLAAKLSMTELGEKVAGREEQYASDLAEKLTGGKYSPVRASGRAYTAFLDKTRADVFDHLIGKAESQGIDVQNDKFLKDLGRYINSATGRGPLGNLQGAATALNAVFFSPRLLASRLDLIFSPVTYAKTDPFVRKEALRSMFQLAGVATTLVGLASLAPGVKTVVDPRNPDWGKIKIGNTRIDIGGGFQQPLRLFAQIATSTAISSTTGKKLNLTAGGYGQPNSLDIFLRFIEGKESPIASVITDKMRNSDQIGNKFNWKNEAQSHLIPLLGQDLADLYHDRKGGVNGIAAAFAGLGVGTFGFGLQTYGPKPPKTSGGSGGPFGSSGLLGNGGGFSSGGGLLSSGG